MTKDSALKLALEALEYASTGNRRPEVIGPAITAIKEALAQPEHEWVRGECVKCGQSIEQLEQCPHGVDDGACKECYSAQTDVDRRSTQSKETFDQQEPVAWMCSDFNLMHRGYSRFSPTRQGEWNIPVYTAPPQRKPLTDEKIEDIWADCPADWDDKINVLTLARAIEAAHGIKE